MRRKKVKVFEYNVIFTPEKEGGFSVSVPDLPGCYSQGETFEEAKANISEAIQLYLEDVDEQLYFLTKEESRQEFLVPISVQVYA